MSPSLLEPGTRVGGYTIGRRLGAGASGAVYAATDDGGSEVALKLLHPHLDIDPDARQQMQKEVSVLQRLRDPNVAQVLDAELDGSEAFIVTELIPGPTLAAEVATGGPLDELDLYELADQLATALHKTHLAGVLHRDLKPSNVIVAEQGPVLIDFGVASDIEELPAKEPYQFGTDPAAETEQLLVVGTPGYLAPELLDGSAPTPATDWWSWAALLAYAATGRPPFGGGARDDVLLRTRQGRADLVGLPPRTATALMGALAPDPATRTSPTEVLQAIRRDGDQLRMSSTVVLPPVAVIPDDRGEADTAEYLAATEVANQGSESGLLAATTVLEPVEPVAGADPTQVIVWDPTQKLAWADLAQDTTVLAAPTQVFPPVPASVAPASGIGGFYPMTPDVQQTAPLPATQYAAPAPVQMVPALPYPTAPAWYARPVPPSRTGLVLAIAALLVALATGWPLIAFGVLVILVVVARCVGTAWDDLTTRREFAGERRSSDAAVLALKTPWILLKSLLGALPQILVGLATGVLVAAAAWWVIGRFEIPASVIADHAHLLGLTLAALATTIVTWFATNSARTRLGARIALSALGPRNAITYILMALLLIAATVIIVFVFTTQFSINWWPSTPPPAL